MNDILKQRLVGALVLIALGVVFWPVVFVETERSTMDHSTQLEPMPEMDDVALPDPRPLADVEPVSAADRIARVEPPDSADTEPEPALQEDDAGAPETGSDGDAVAASAPSDEPRTDITPADSREPAPAGTPASPSLDENGLPVAWVLQVASLSSREKADALTADLVARDYQAYSRAVQRDGVVFYRVFVGPVFERAKLAEAKREIDQQLKVSAIIARYVP